MSMNQNGVIYRIARGCYRKTLKPFVIGYKTRHNRLLVERSVPMVESVRNIHEGHRCFIIGNGPSLIASDLDRLKNEICFGANRIYKIFDKTNWRPTYYCVGDDTLIRNSAKVINEKIVQKKYVGLNKIEIIPKLKDAVYSYFSEEEDSHDPDDPILPKFSDDITKCYYQGFTVTYMSLQLAVYMGFKEIYLLGVDNNYSVMIDPSGKVVRQDGVADHFSSDYQTEVIPTLYKFTYAYMAAKKYTDAHGIKIINATRGGKLEVFPREDFDELSERLHLI